MNRAVIEVFKLVVGDKSDRWFLAANYADMVKVVKARKRELITDIEAIKALCHLNDDNQGKEVIFVTKKYFDQVTKDLRV